MQPWPSSLGDEYGIDPPMTRLIRYSPDLGRQIRPTHREEESSNDVRIAPPASAALRQG